MILFMFFVLVMEKKIYVHMYIMPHNYRYHFVLGVRYLERLKLSLI
jgi:hypothetical protein